jgi:hypothetical protein
MKKQNKNIKSILICKNAKTVTELQSNAPILIVDA